MSHTPMSSGNPSSRTIAAFPSCPIDPKNDPGGLAKAFLEGVQGNILKGHGRDHARVVFFRFDGPQEENAQFLKDAVALDPKTKMGRWVSSAWHQNGQIDVWHMAREYLVKRRADVKLTAQEKKNGADFIERAKRQVLGGLQLTGSGLRKLGYSRTEIEELSFELARGLKSGLEGQLPHARLTAHWEKPYVDADAFDGMFLLASNHPEDLDEQIRELVLWCWNYQVAVLSQIETATTWRDEDCHSPSYERPREAFGFVDGISMPMFFKKIRPLQTINQGAPEAWEWIDLKFKDVFLAPPRPEGNFTTHTGGSLFVLLKLEQDVKGFRAHEKNVADRLAHAGMDTAQAATVAATLATGRSREGNCPVHSVPHRRLPDRKIPPELNEFDFRTTVKGSECPFHAHIRKMNPRIDYSSNVGTKDSIIESQPVRRGMVYDPLGLLRACERKNRAKPPEEHLWPSDKVGLLFMAYAHHLGVQFEKLHSGWAGDTMFPDSDTGQTDPVLLPGNGTAWQHANTTLPSSPSKSFVKHLGGAYFYVPSIAWLERGGAKLP